jgi:hypothetical protein
MTRRVVTWLGEDLVDEGTGQEVPGPSFNIWGDTLTRAQFKFAKGEGVVVDDEEGPVELRQLARHIIEVADTNQHYTIEEEVIEPPPEEPSPEGDDPLPWEEDEEEHHAARTRHVPPKRKPKK